MATPDDGQKNGDTQRTPRGRVLWFGRRGAIPTPAETQAAMARKRVTNLFELFFTLLIFSLAGLVWAVLEFANNGLTAICFASLFLAITLAAFADWIFILLRRELRKRKETSEEQA